MDLSMENSNVITVSFKLYLNIMYTFIYCAQKIIVYWKLILLSEERNKNVLYKWCFSHMQKPPEK